MERKRIKCALLGSRFYTPLRACLLCPPQANGCKLKLNTCLRETSAPNGDSARKYSFTYGLTMSFYGSR